MAFRVEITDSASEDLDEIVRYLVQDLLNEKYATRLLNEIAHRYDLLAEQPFLYPLSAAQRLADKGYRKAVIDNYIMMHRVDEARQTVYIINFYYGRQNYENYI